MMKLFKVFRIADYFHVVKEQVTQAELLLQLVTE